MAAFVEDRTDTHRLRELSDDQSEDECEENRYCCKLYTIENEELMEQYREKLNCLERLKTCYRSRVNPHTCKLLALKLARARIGFLKKALEREHQEYDRDCAQLVEDQKEVEMLASSVFRRTLGVLKKSQSVLKVKDVKKTVFQRLREEQKQLKEVKGSFVREAQQYLFPLEVESVTLDDEGEKSVAASSPLVNLDVDIELEGEWLLSGHTRLPTPRIKINDIPLPIDGDYLEYHSSSQGDPHTNSAARISAGLCNVAQFMHLLQRILSVPLPYPLSLVSAIRDYGRSDLGHRKFTKMVSKLDSNVLFLCMTQNVSPSALVGKGHGTISNLFNLVTHQDIGSCSSFTCYPELFAYNHASGFSLADSIIDHHPPSFFAVSDHLDDPEDDLPSHPNSLELTTLETSLKQEFSHPCEGPSTVDKTPPLLSSGVEGGGMAHSTSSGVMSSVSGIWTSVTRYWK
jgi:hypothetical protein